MRRASSSCSCRRRCCCCCCCCCHDIRLMRSHAPQREMHGAHAAIQLEHPRRSRARVHLTLTPRALHLARERRTRTSFTTHVLCPTPVAPCLRRNLRRRAPKRFVEEVVSTDDAHRDGHERRRTRSPERATEHARARCVKTHPSPSISPSRVRGRCARAILRARARWKTASRFTADVTFSTP